MLSCAFLRHIEHILNADAVAWGRVVYKHMGDRSYEPAVLDYRAAGHTLNYAAGHFEQLGIGDRQHDRRVLGIWVHLFYLDTVFMHLAAGERAQYRRLADGNVAGLDGLSVKARGAENSAAAVYAYIAEKFRAVGAAVKLPRSARLSGHDADYLRIVYSAVAERQSLTGAVVADTVAERAVNSGSRIIECQRAYAAHAVAQPQAELPRALSVLHGRYGKLLCFALALDGNGGLAFFNILERNSLDGYLLLVVRYYGGVKLGASNLLRAYNSAANLCIKKMITT